MDVRGEFRPTRRFAAVVLVLALLGTNGPTGNGARARIQGAQRRPNVVLIVMDDQRDQGTRQVMGSLRRLFYRKGYEFPHAFAPNPLCCPSRASILTGRYPHNHDVTRNGQATALDQQSTLQRYLDDAGYRTGIFGKFLFDWPLTDPPPHFDDYVFTEGGNTRDNYFGGPWNVQGDVREVSRYSTDFLARRTTRFISATEADDASPWFMYVTPLAPHRPYIAEERYDDARVPRWQPSPAVHEKNRADKPPFVKSQSQSLNEIRRTRRRQLRTLMSVDDLIARINRRIVQEDEKRRTLIFVTSDNGYLWGEHGLLHKRHAYTPSIAVPLALRWPGHLSPGVSARRLVSLVDITPTVLDVAEISPDPSYPLDGRSLFSDRRRKRVLIEYAKDVGIVPAWASLRSRSYQYTEYYNESGQITFREYYHLKDDPWQLRNRLGDRKSSNDPAVRRLHRRLRAARSCTGNACP